MSTKINRTFDGLRNALFDEIDAMREGRGNYEQARAIVQASAQINETVHAEAKVRKMIGIPAAEGDVLGLLVK